MIEIFIPIVLGHFVADYLFQNREMAIRKSEKGLIGFLWCFVPCVIYTATICAFLQTLDPMMMFLVFMSHFPIDRWSLAGKWLRFIGGRDILAAYNSVKKYREIDLSFSCLVYAIADNTMHLVLLYWMTLYLF
jgi:hypothetical protein